MDGTRHTTALTARERDVRSGVALSSADPGEFRCPCSRALHLQQASLNDLTGRTGAAWMLLGAARCYGWAPLVCIPVTRGSSKVCRATPDLAFGPALPSRSARTGLLGGRS